MITKMYVEKPRTVKAVKVTAENIEDVYKFIHGEYSLNLNSKEAKDGWHDLKRHYSSYGIPMSLTNPELGTVRINEYVLKDLTGKCTSYTEEVFNLLYTETYE